MSYYENKLKDLANKTLKYCIKSIKDKKILS